MSNPVTTAEVEDVLSSIRRLVSEDKRPLPNATKKPPSDRLVLTPALRVAPDQETPVPKMPGAAPFVLDDTEFEEAEESASAPVDVPVFKEPTLDEPADDGGSDPYGVVEMDNALAVPASNEDPEPPVATPRSGSSSVFRNISSALHGEKSDAQPGRDGRFPPTSRAQEPQVSPKPSALSDKIAALETAIGKISDRWEPDQAGTDDYSGTQAPAMAWEDDAAHRDAMGAPIAAETQDAPPLFEAEATSPSVEENVDYAAEDQLIDEEALRDLVSEIVRAELQGALGERITRNVRKLVRREIHRALTAQELD